MAIILKSELSSSLDIVDVGKVNIFLDTSDTTLKYKKSDGSINFLSPNRYNVSGSTATTFTVTSIDVGKYNRLSSSSGISVIVSASLGLNVGDTFNFFQAGSGQLTFVAVGTQINTAETLKTKKFGAAVTLVYVGTNVFDLFGDLELAWFKLSNEIKISLP